MLRCPVPLLALLLAAGPALAHSDHGAEGSLAAGLLHPLLGSDHLLAMVTVGLLAAAERGRARLLLPLAFVGAMAAGLLLGVAGVPLPFVEGVILASVVVLGTLLALGLHPRHASGAALAAFFGLFHGAAHGQEMGLSHLLPYAAGVLAATAFLHAAGLSLATVLLSILGRATAALPLRMLGAGLGLGGLALVFQA